MSGIITHNLRVFFAKQLWKQFQSSNNTDHIYLCIGRNTPWQHESSPSTPVDTVANTNFNVWRDLMAAKRITSGDVSFAAPRHTWTSGTTYAMYQDNSSTVFSNNFFVLTSDYNVYKCIDNNNGVQSTVRPTGIVTAPVITSDGYTWQYMYTLGADVAIKFLTDSFIPVHTLTESDGSAQWTVQAAATNGSIDIVKVVSGGNSYGGANGTIVSANSTTATLDASASGASGYYNGSALYVASGPGAGQIRNITGWDHSTRVARISSAWANTPTSSSTYVVGPRITATGDGSGFSAYAGVSSSGHIDRVRVINPGTNYSRITVTASGNTGSGASLTGYLTPPGGHGADPVNELAAHNIILSVQLDGSESNTIMTTNEYRVIALIANPVLSNTGVVANSSIYDQTTHLPVGSAVGSFVEDEMVTGANSAATGSIVSANSSLIRLTSVTGSFVIGEVVTGANSAAHATISSAPRNPPLRLFSGIPLYIENRGAIARSVSQKEVIKTVIRF
jgi:hypothetical protein